MSIMDDKMLAQHQMQARDKDGRVYVWDGFVSAQPELIPGLPGGTSVKVVSLGAQHGAFLTQNGQLYMCGNNNRGQIGIGTSITSTEAARLVTVPTCEFVVDVCCGRNHTVAATGSGLVFCWGENTDHQCGTVGDQCVMLPQHVPIVTHGSIEKMMIGDRCLTPEALPQRGISSADDSGDIVVENGRLNGDGILNGSCSKPDCCHSLECHQTVDGCPGLLNSIKIIHVSAGWTHTAVLSDCGRIWSWGTGNQLGLGDCIATTYPQPVELPSDRQAVSVSCGGQHTIALVIQRKSLSAKDSSCGSNNSLNVTELNVSGMVANTKKPIPTAFYDNSEVNSLNSYSAWKDLTGRICSDNPPENGVDHACDIPLQDISPVHRVCNDEVKSADESYLTADNPALLASTCIDDLADRDAAHEISGDSPTEASECRDKLSVLSSSPVLVVSAETNSIKTESENNVTENGSTVEQFLDTVVSHSSDLNVPSNSDDISHNTQESTESTSFQLASVPKSRSTFLDETEAKVFLQRQLSDIDPPVEATETASTDGGTTSSDVTTPDKVVEKKDSVDVTPATMSPFAKTVGNILQRVPSSPVIVQEYVTNLTRSVVSNLRTSMDRRFNFVTSQVEFSLSGLASLGKVPVHGGSDSTSMLDDFELLERLEASPNDLSSVSLPKSTSMGLEPVRFTHHRQGSLPDGAFEAARIGFSESRRCQLIHLETEVWSWGGGSHGQLGHADLLDRSRPYQMTSLDQCQIVKIVAGGHHTVALSATCQVYTWGDNSSGQLGHTHRGTTTPHLVAMFGRMPCCDVAAGDEHTIVLCDGLSTEPHIYFCGLASQASKISRLSRFDKLKVGSLVSSVQAGGACRSTAVVCGNSAIAGAIYELSANERLFHVTLDRIDQLFIQPLLQLEAAQDQHDILCDLQSLSSELSSVMRLSAVHHLRLSHLLSGAHAHDVNDALYTFLLRDTDERLWAFQQYADRFADSLVCGIFSRAVKSHKGFFDKCKLEFGDILEESKIDVSNVSLTFERLLQLPLQRPREYQKSVAKIAQLYPAYTMDYARLNKLAQSWQSLKQKITVGLQLATKTFAYWQTAPAKILEALQSSERRLVRDSRAHPMSLSTASRFSSTHTFLLFNDCFVHIQYSGHQVYPLGTVWVEIVPDSKQIKNSFTLMMPEDNLTLTCPSHSDKAEWVWCLNQTIARALAEERSNLLSMSTQNGVTSSVLLESTPSVGSAMVLLQPPRDRHGAYTFTKAGPLKDAQYKGMWRNSKIHGHGELVWPDGRRYCGQFVEGQFEGVGVHTQPTDDLGVEISEGTWKTGQLHGQARVRYSNGDVYKGAFVEGKKQGHGVLKQGKFSASIASVFIGQWLADKRHGYGVSDDIPKGQKYMGMWMDDNRHGNGIIVTLDGLYFEGNFVSGKITGQGLLMTEDNCCYEGEFAGGPNLSGKGVLTLPNGDYIEGQFYGSFGEGIKVSGTFRKANVEQTTDHKLPSSPCHVVLPKRYGKLCVAASRKWDELFTRCYTQLLGAGSTDLQAGSLPQPSNELSDRVWQNIAAILNNASTSSYRPKQKKRVWNLDDLQTIPDHNICPLTLENYNSVRCYLVKAFDTAIHPLSELLDTLVDSFLTTYVGVGSHLRLLHHAVEEFKSYIDRLYPVVRLLFPSLPDADHLVHIYPEANQVSETDQALVNVVADECEWVTPTVLLYPLLLPKIYPPLFNLYALYNEKDDDRYWKRIRLWNKQSNPALMSYLGVDQKFWMLNDAAVDESQILTVQSGEHYIEAIDRLQRISTSFSPTEKLSQIQSAFDEINKVVQGHLGNQYQWSMDDLFPVFQYVVVRSRIQHLAAEIHFIDDLMEAHLQNGELGIMFTTLKACYFQILNEKVI